MTPTNAPCTRVAVLRADDGTHKKYPVPADIPLQPTYEFDGHTWTVIAVVGPTALHTVSTESPTGVTTNG